MAIWAWMDRMPLRGILGPIEVNERRTDWEPSQCHWDHQNHRCPRLGFGTWWRSKEGRILVLRSEDVVMEWGDVGGQHWE